MSSRFPYSCLLIHLQGDLYQALQMFHPRQHVCYLLLAELPREPISYVLDPTSAHHLTLKLLQRILCTDRGKHFAH